jgi:Na+-transporting NADH:ubiquinone oxidoreductase subunit A
LKKTITKGYDIKIKGIAEKEIAVLNSDKVAYTLSDFNYIKPKVLVKEGDKVQKGTALICDKKNQEVVFVSPASGVVEKINRGDRNLLLHVIIKKENDESVDFGALSSETISGMSSDDLKKALMQRGLWPYIRRRPYNKIALITDEPKCIFINAMDSSPLSADPEFYLKDRVEDFKTGVAALSKLCPTIHICSDADNGSSIFSAAGAQDHQFAGKHPKGNLSVHIENIEPVVNNEKVVWSLRAQDVVAMGKSLSTGHFDAERVMAWVGPAAKERKYYKTTLGTSTSSLPKEEGEIRLISGSVLAGTQLDENGFLGFYDNTIVAIKEGRERKLLGWLQPGFNAESLTRCYVSSIKPQKEYEHTTTNNGEFRAIVDSEMYDRVQPLDIHTIFLFKALLAEDIEEAERHGLWSVMPEDFALASYMDPSKNNFGAAVQSTLDMLHKEEN